MDEKIKDLIPQELSQAEIAAHCGVKQQAVSLWLKNDEVPAKRAGKFSEITGIEKHLLNQVFRAEAFK